jgi:hypothetical protein
MIGEDARAVGDRNSSKIEPAALKPAVFILATLFATTSSSRESATCRDKPTSSVLSILLPFAKRISPKIRTAQLPRSSPKP